MRWRDLLLYLSAAALLGAWSGLDLSATPPDPQPGAGPTISLGRVGLDPCPSGYCRPEPNGNLFYFMTKGTHPIEPVPGVVLKIPFGGPNRR
jgi:hypothetical protein